jgi:hypothetical protein
MDTEGGRTRFAIHLARLALDTQIAVNSYEEQVIELIEGFRAGMESIAGWAHNRDQAIDLSAEKLT